jgi:hypothetical protein
LPLRLDQLHKVDRLRVKESTVVDVMRLAVQEIKEILLQGFATSPRLGRKRTPGGFRDPVNLEINHGTHLATACLGAALGLRLATEQPALSGPSVFFVPMS